MEVGRLLVTFFFYCMKRNSRPRELIKAKQTEKINGHYCWNVSLEEAFEICRSSFSEHAQNVTIIDQGKHKIEQIYIGNPMTTGFAVLTLIYIISMEFLSLRRRRPSCRNDLSGGERGEAAVFATCLFYRRKFGLSVRFWESAHLPLP